MAAIVGTVGHDAGVPLVLAGVPIGDPADASPRLRAVLEAADVVAAEDTRRLRRLAADLGITVGGRVISHYDANETQRVDELVAQIAAGRTVVVVTDAGMPTVSDPGYRLVAAAAAAALPVTVVPGPSAATAALAVSGLPSDRWCFEGFLPRKPAARRARLAELAVDPRTLVLFEAPHRLAATLGDLVSIFGADRPAVACRELTKTYEEIARGTLGDLAAWVAGGVKGEVTLVVGGAPGAVADIDALVGEVAAREAAGASRRDAIAQVARDHGVSRRELYAAVLHSLR